MLISAGLQIRIPADRLVNDPRSTGLVRPQSATPEIAPADRDSETDDLQLFTQHIIRFHAPLTENFKYVADDGIAPSEQAFTIPLHDAPLHTGEAVVPSLNLRELQESWYQATPVFAASADEARVTFAFWYLDGRRWPICEHPRLITLPHPTAHWEQLIGQLWNDRVQLGTRLLIEPLKPQPKDDSVAGHFLLHQNIAEHLAGVLLSVFRHDDISRLHRRFASITQCRPRFQDLWVFTDFDEACRTRQFLCVGFHGSEPLETGDVIPLSIGDHIELHVACWSVVSNAFHTTNDDEEHVSLMQHGQTTIQNHASVCGIGLPSAPQEGGTFQFQANAPAFVPGVPWGLDALDEFIQDLFTLWDETAFAWEDQDRSCSVAVWFVDHHWQYPHCVAPRVVRLYPDVHEWRRHIWQAWQDQVIPGHELEFSIVSPRPPTVDATVAAHVVIIQRPNDFWVTSIVSCFEFGTAETRMTQMAVTTHEHILLENLARVMGFFEACFGHTHAQNSVLQRMVPCPFNRELLWQVVVVMAS